MNMIHEKEHEATELETFISQLETQSFEDRGRVRAHHFLLSLRDQMENLESELSSFEKTLQLLRDELSFEVSEKQKLLVWSLRTFFL
jgi:hypothetical protein